MAHLEADGAGQTALLGVSLKHVVAELSGRAAPGLAVTGGRAPLALAQAERFYKHFALEPHAELQIEWAIPVALGLGSQAVLGLSVARALALLHGLPAHSGPALAEAIGLGAEHALETWAFERGGLLLVAAGSGTAGTLPEPLARREFGQPERDAWALVMFHQKAPAGTPETLEADRAASLRAAAPHLPAESGRLIQDEMWPALAADDIARFGQALMALHALNREALGRMGAEHSLAPEEQEVLDMFSSNGAYAWGRSLTGLALYGLVRGQTMAAEMKKKLLALKGHFAGTTMATSMANEGARATFREGVDALPVQGHRSFA